MKDYKNLATDLVKRTKMLGADSSDIYISSSKQFSVEMRLGKTEKLEEATSVGIGIRIFKRGSIALGHTTDLSPQSIASLIEDTIKLADITDSDQSNHLPDPELLSSYKGDIDLFDPDVDNMSIDEKLEKAKEVEAIAMQQDSRITNSRGSWWRDAEESITVANSSGFVDSYKTTDVSFGVSLLAEENGVKQSDGWWSSNRFISKLKTSEFVAKESALRTTRKLGAKSVKTQTVPVVFDPQIGQDFLKIILQAVDATQIVRRSSFLIDKLGERVGNDHVTIIDDATLKEGSASRPFDAEGCISKRNLVIENGRLLSYLCDTYSASRLNLKPTSNASRSYSSHPSVGASNFYLKPGISSPKDIIKSVSKGLLLTRLYWVGINPITGDYSRGAEGIWIENGELTHYVQEITVAGNILNLMQNIVAIGNDLEFDSSIASPTILISSAVVSGT